MPKKFLTLLIPVVLLAVAFGAFWLFASEPSQPQLENGWKETTDEHGVKFRYPEQLTTTYIHTVDWPPQITVTQGPFTCTEAGLETGRAGQTQKRRVDNREYCVTTVTQGAAGSIYTQYSYITAHGNNKLVNLTFTLRSVQCANYDDPQKSQCQGERETFDLDGLIDRIVKTI